jgi:hypothetical protein
MHQQQESDDDEGDEYYNEILQDERNCSEKETAADGNLDHMKQQFDNILSSFNSKKE